MAVGTHGTLFRLPVPVRLMTIKVAQLDASPVFNPFRLGSANYDLSAEVFRAVVACAFVINRSLPPALGTRALTLHHFDLLLLVSFIM